MTEQHPGFRNHRVEVTFPDLSRWSAGNTGIPYLWTFDSGRDGPHLGIQALTHGNEVCGAIVLDFFLSEQLRPVRGKLSLCFANAAAYRKWDPAEPFKSRFVDEDFNRLWSPEVLDGGVRRPNSAAREALRPFYDQLDYLLDIHSMSDPCPPLMLAGVQHKASSWRSRWASPSTSSSTPATRPAGACATMPASTTPAIRERQLLVECGQHWAQKAPEVARQVACASSATSDWSMRRSSSSILTEGPSRRNASSKSPLDSDPHRVVRVHLAAGRCADRRARGPARCSPVTATPRSGRPTTSVRW
jgi:hypothetical protein